VSEEDVRDDDDKGEEEEDVLDDNEEKEGKEDEDEDGEKVEEAEPTLRMDTTGGRGRGGRGK
jgi:hypothetical protein